MKSEKLYEDKDVVFEHLGDGKYRVTFFKEDNHWGGDITMSKKDGVILDDVKEKEPIDAVSLYERAEDWTSFVKDTNPLIKVIAIECACIGYRKRAEEE